MCLKIAEFTSFYRFLAAKWQPHLIVVRSSRLTLRLVPEVDSSPVAHFIACRALSEITFPVPVWCRLFSWYRSYLGERFPQRETWRIESPSPFPRPHVANSFKMSREVLFHRFWRATAPTVRLSQWVPLPCNNPTGSTSRSNAAVQPLCIHF